MTLPDIISLYIAAWNEPEPARRKSLLDHVWEEDGTYSDPMAQVVGKEALMGYIGELMLQFPGARLEQASAIDAHHDKLRFSWRLILADGSVHTEGTDFGVISSAGRLSLITGFFGPLAAEEIGRAHV